MLARQYDEIAAFQQEKFSDQSSTAKIKHLQKEVKELDTEIREQSAEKLTELADCFILLGAIAHTEGIKYIDIVRAIDHKMSINKLRNWGKPDADGVVKHVRQGNGSNGIIVEVKYNLTIERAKELAINHGYKIYYRFFSDYEYIYFQNGNWFDELSIMVLPEFWDNINKEEFKTGWAALPFLETNNG